MREDELEERGEQLLTPIELDDIDGEDGIMHCELEVVSATRFRWSPGTWLVDIDGSAS